MYATPIFITEAFHRGTKQKPLTVIRKWYVSNALKFNQNSRFLFTKTLQWKCLSTHDIIAKQ